LPGAADDALGVDAGTTTSTGGCCSVAAGTVEVEAPAVFVIGAVAALRTELAVRALEEVAL